MKFLSQNEDPKQHKILHNPPIKYIGASVEGLRSRKTDDTLIIVMKEKVKVKITNS